MNQMLLLSGLEAQIWHILHDISIRELWARPGRKKEDVECERDMTKKISESHRGSYVAID